MSQDIYTIRPIYGKGVKITDWYEDYSQYPFDNPNPKNSSHYRTFGPTDEVFIPKSTAKEAMEQGRQIPQTLTKGVKRPQVNFTSYPLINNDRIFGIKHEHEIPSLVKRSIQRNISIYKQSHVNKQPIMNRPRRDCCKEETLHHLFDRLPKNDFTIASPSSENKFMDDHIVEPTRARRHSNFLRQLRKRSFIPWLGTYQDV